MKQFNNSLLLLILIISPTIIFANDSTASGIGAYFESGGGYLNTIYNNYSITEYNSKTENINLTGGILFDTNLSNKGFNYRIKIGGERFKADWFSETDLSAFTLRNNFGISLINDKLLKIWLGPQIGIKYIVGDNKRTYLGIEVPDLAYNALSVALTGIYYYLAMGFLEEKMEYSLFGLNAGLVLGFNINISKYATITIDGGPLYGFYSGDVIRKTVFILDIFPINNIKDRTKWSGFEWYASLGVAYRFQKE